ncbi:MAG TPA: DEAD/DEAH box helicase [Candidatus Kapabacteria bacterium]|nr:DEAD/DEAH box helicase [Candidatus Kapabacteria bacterium]
MVFQDLGIIDSILRALHEEGYRTPTPIQQQAIPIVLQGKDLLGVAQTGTGKTAAFAVPILQLLKAGAGGGAGHAKGKRKHIRCLILTPTRELAVQIEESFEAYGRHVGLSSVVIFGGVKQGAQTSALHRGVDIVVATPGRLLDLMDQGYVDLSHVEIFVLDEADRMLDMGFVRDVRDIIAELPQKRQTLFFSATMPAAIVSLASDILDHPVKVAITPPATTVDMIQQLLYYVEKSKKPDLLLQILEDKRIRSALVFTRTKRGADVVVRTLERNRINAEAIHGNKAQNARQRALTNFKAKKTRVLVATDIAARGIDVDDLEYVINYEIPNVPETYVHRIGRTGRAGASGTALSFCAPDEKPFVRDIEKLTGKKIPVAHDHPFAKSERAPEPQLTHARPQQHSRQQNSRPQPSNRQDGRQQDSNPNRQLQKPAQHSNQKPKANQGRRRRWPGRG